MGGGAGPGAPPQPRPLPARLLTPRHRHAQSLLDLQASAAERSQPPPSYADKVSPRWPARRHRRRSPALAQVALAANTSCLTREAALDALGTVSQRPAAIAGALPSPALVHPSPASPPPLAPAVYAHWLSKRKRLGKPVLRRLQQPPAVTDPNPFAVFRPREKANRCAPAASPTPPCRISPRGRSCRPQTRRRRENDSAAYHRMQKLRQNLDHSRAILEWLQRRERRKRDILLCEMESQQMQLRMRHDPRAPPPQARPPPAASLPPPSAAHAPAPPTPAAAPAAPEPARQRGAQTLAEQQPAQGRAATQQLADAAQKREKRRRRDGRDRPRQTDHAFLPPPELPEPEMPFLCAPDLEVSRPSQAPPSPPPLTRAPQMRGFQLPGAAHRLCGRTRFGRGGRLVIDLVDPLTREPILTKVRRPKPAPAGALPAAGEAVAMEH